MTADNRWLRMLRPGIIMILGAGGKTTVLERLGTFGHANKYPLLVSSTVPVDSARVDNVEPFDVICTDDIEKGMAFCEERIATGHLPAWFSRLNEEDCYEGLSPTLIDQIKHHHPAWYILIEGDYTQNKWLKAPLPNDVPLPVDCDLVIGVVNLQMLGMALTADKVAGIETATAIMGRAHGAIVTPSMLATLLMHPRGLFRGAACAKILFCTGYNAVQHRMTSALLDDLTDLDLEASVLADGYRDTCIIRQYVCYGVSRDRNE